MGTPVLDLQRLEEIASLEAFRPGMRRRMLGLFEQVVVDHVAKCRPASGSDAHAIRESAHALKGAATSIGASRFGALASEVERAAQSSSDDLADLAAQLPIESERALAALRVWVEQPMAGG